MRLIVCKIACAVLLPLALLADWRQDMDGLCWRPIATAEPARIGNLMVQYAMNESNATTVVTDSSGNSRNGTSVRNTSLMSSAGKIGNSFAFNGSGDKVTYSIANAFSNGTTLMAWINTTQTTEGYVIACQDGNIILEINATGGANKVSVVAFDTGFQRCHSSSAVNGGAWVHVSGVVTADALYIYVNGVQEASLPVGNIGVYSGLIVGSHPSAARFNGRIDDARWYNRALSSNEVYTIATALSETN